MPVKTIIYRVFWKYMAMDSAETRYAHLLQPLRDLTKNWDIDLASQLGEYLEEVRKHTEIKHHLSDLNVPFFYPRVSYCCCFWQLDQMTISFDGGKTMMNFAEAALLIQGSTCIYGRKVNDALCVQYSNTFH